MGEVSVYRGWVSWACEKTGPLNTQGNGTNLKAGNSLVSTKRLLPPKGGWSERCPLLRKRWL